MPASAAATRERARGLVARRPLSEAERRAALARAGHAPGEIDSAIAALRRAGHVDDRRLAEQVIRSHARRGQPLGRARQALERRGVAPERIREAEEEVRLERGDAADVDLRERVRDLLAREGRPVDERTVRRVYNRLLRAGFEETEVRSALEPFLSPEARPDAEDDGSTPRGRRTTGYDDELT